MESQTNDEQFHFPLIETERLMLRMFEADDLDAAFVLFNDGDVQKYLSPANRRTREQLQFTLESLASRWQERGFGIWCVCEKGSKKMIGYSGFQYLDNTPQVEILFGYLKDSWGNGFATEAANACLRFGFEEVRCSKICAATHPENLASRCVLEKIGMVFDKKSEHYRMDSMTFAVSRDEYTPSKDFYKLNYENHRIETKPKSVHANHILYFI
jgi:ribosomal-protein-alanine N-acetyltransferase